MCILVRRITSDVGVISYCKKSGKEIFFSKFWHGMMIVFVSFLQIRTPIWNFTTKKSRQNLPKFGNNFLGQKRSPQILRERGGISILYLSPPNPGHQLFEHQPKLKIILGTSFKSLFQHELHVQLYKETKIYSFGQMLKTFSQS